MGRVEINWVFQPCTSRLFGLVFLASYDEHTALVKIGNVASEHVRSSQWNVSLVEPGYRDLLSYVTFLLVMWPVLCCSFSTRELVQLRKRRDIFEQCCDQFVVQFSLPFSVIRRLCSARCISLLSVGVVE